MNRPVLRPALIMVSLAALTACSTRVPIDEPEMSQSDAQVCRTLVDDLPGTLADELRRSVEPDDALGAAWGDDPPYVLTCGVPAPAAVPEDATCFDFGHDVGWYVPERDTEGTTGTVVATTLTHTPRVSLEVPPSRRRHGVDSALTELGLVLARHLELGKPCV